MPTEQPTPRRVVGLIPRRPALAVAALFIGGIFAHTNFPHAPLLWAAITLLCAAGAVVSYRSTAASSACLFAGIFCAGVGIAQLEAFYYPRDTIAAFATDQPRLAQLELLINHEPRTLTDPFGQHPMPPKQVVTAKVQRVKTWSGWVNASGDILVQIAQPHPRLANNQVIRVLGTLERPAPAMNPGQFDWASYYREQRILTSLHVQLAPNIEILEQYRDGPRDIIRAQSRRLLAAGFDPARSLDHALLRALLLGDNDPELRDVQEQFRRSGTSHHLTISGMHVAVLSGFVFGICRLLRLRPRWALVTTTAFVVVYGIAAMPSPPVMRSILLCLLFGVGLVLGRSVDPLQLLALSVLAMLMWHPMDLYNAGFQLSFGTVFGLMLFTKPVMSWFDRL